VVAVDTVRRFAIVYATLLLVLPTYVFMFVFVGTLSVAGWIVLATVSNTGAVPILFIQVAAWMAVEALLASGLTWVANRVSARTRHLAFGVGVICALSAAANPIYCYSEGVQTASGGCTNAVAAFWWGR